ncbi:30S ribosomal protein S2 [bacterium]|nr:30S ribosomal protein S2 [bacterium]
MTTVSMKQLLESGVHFGHQTRRWNPKMAKYIFGQRNGIYIIDLKKTVRLLKEACRFVKEVSQNGGTVLFVGTKKQAQDTVKEEASRCNMFYVNQRWLGGTLTNFQTVSHSIRKLKDLESKLADETSIDHLTKKERLFMAKDREKLNKNLAGIKNMDDVPSVMFVTDTRKDKIAVLEARRLNIPVVAIVDTNCDPDDIDYVIPGNDDAIRAVRLISARIADAILEGQMAASEGSEAEEQQMMQQEVSSESAETPKEESAAESAPAAAEAPPQAQGAPHEPAPQSTESVEPAPRTEQETPVSAGQDNETTN